MVSEGQWADYARIQDAAKIVASIPHSDANDVRLNRVLDRISIGETETNTDIERAVKSHARRERSRSLARRITGHAFAPSGAVSPEQALIWKQTWLQFQGAFSAAELRLLVKNEIISTHTPTSGADRTRLSRIKSSTAYRSARATAFI